MTHELQAVGPDATVAGSLPHRGNPGLRPNLGVCQLMLPDTSFREDVQYVAAAGFGALGVWEAKLIEGQEDVQAQLMRMAGLAASAAVPLNISPLPADPAYPGPTDPDERVEAMKSSIRRLAPFRPSAIVVVTGTADGLGNADARRIAVEGLREAAREAARHQLALSLEPIPRHPRIDISIPHTITEAMEWIQEIGEPNVGLCWDACNLAGTENVFALTEHYTSLINSVHLADLRAPRGPIDRRLPGEGDLDLAGMLSALGRGGYSGTIDLEVLAADGLDHDGPAALWRLPPFEFMERARAAAETVWGRSHAANNNQDAYRTRRTGGVSNGKA